ncbi:MAG: pyridoxal-phosphate dependent enzyme [Polyangiaceae bacterium]|nr:pyridoxal-phosphate dependent enzyme [Polyangiaceae bacterium]
MRRAPRFAALAMLLAAAPACSPRGAAVDRNPPVQAPKAAEPAPSKSAEKEPDRREMETSGDRGTKFSKAPLFKRFPELEAKIHHRALGSLPTPVERAEKLGEALGIRDLYIKRDDLAGETYGGSKIRKLEFLLAEAKSLGKARVITFGGSGSNHAVATALYAQKLGLKATLMLLPQPINDEVRHRLLAARHFGAEIRIGPGSARARAAEATKALKEDGIEPYWIEMGGTSPLGNVGLVNAAFELKEQVDAGQMPEPDVLYIALGTMGSAAGLMLGLKAAGMKTVVVPVRASSPDTSSEARLAAMIKETNEYLRALDPSFPAIDMGPLKGVVRGGYLGKGYGLPTRKGTHATAVFKEQTGLDLEATYTGKTFAAVMDDANDLAGKVVLFWNTYGSRKLNLGGTQ